MSNIPKNNFTSISSTEELSIFIGKKIGLHGFSEGDNISGTLMEIGFDHVKVAIAGGVFDGVTVKIDLNIKGNLEPTVQYISCAGTQIYLHKGEIPLTRKLCIEDKVSVEILNLVRAYEANRMSDEEVYKELFGMGIKSIDVVKEVIKNRTLKPYLIGMLQENAK